MYDKRYMPLVTLMFPCRERFVWLQEAIRSFIDNADDPSGVEVLVRVDDDDEHWPSFEQRLAGSPTVLIGSRLNAYLSMHVFYNEMAAISRGEWIWMLNDDVRCLTKGWDTVLKNHRIEQGNDRIALLNPADHENRQSTQFPMLKRGGMEAVGHYSHYAVNDHYLQILYGEVGCLGHILGVKLHHINNDPAGVCPSRLASIGVMGDARTFWDNSEKKDYQEDVRILKAYKGS